MTFSSSRISALSRISILVTDANPKLSNLLKNAIKVWELFPRVGTEIHGVQLSQLDSAGLDELALLAAHRGALVFRDPHPAAESEEHMIIYDHKE